MRYYIIKVHGDVEPEVIGPYAMNRRDEKVKELRANDPEGKNGLFMLNIDEHGSPEVDSYAAGHFE